MATWNVTPDTNVIIDPSTSEITFPKNTTDENITYTISYTSDTNCTGVTTYTVPMCTLLPPIEIGSSNYNKRMRFSCYGYYGADCTNMNHENLHYFLVFGPLCRDSNDRYTLVEGSQINGIETTLYSCCSSITLGTIQNLINKYLRKEDLDDLYAYEMGYGYSLWLLATAPYIYDIPKYGQQGIIGGDEIIGVELYGAMNDIINRGVSTGDINFLNPNTAIHGSGTIINV